MRNLLCLLIVIFTVQNAFAQNAKYDTKWKAVEAAFKKGLNKTAEKEIAEILQMAKAENNTEQIIKALCNYRVSLRDRDEKARVNDILLFEKELKDAKFPVKQILHSMLGDLYWTYYEEHRWQILNRTTIEIPKEENPKSKDKTSSDIETWTATDFYNAAYKHFNASLSEADKSKTFPVKNIYMILDNEKNTEKLRPTLYDFLVHRAINYFAQEENDLTKPAYAFEINDEKAYSNASAFAITPFKTSDTTSQKYQVIKLYQKIISFHLNDADPSALIDADIARIRYVHQHTTLSNKKELYLIAMKNIVAVYPDNEQAAMASYYIAETYTQEGNNRDWGFYSVAIAQKNTDYVTAKKILDAIVEKYPKTEAASKAEAMIRQIETHSLSIQNEKAVMPDQPSLAFVRFKNISKVYCKIVKVSVPEYRTMISNYDESFKQIINKPVVKEWSATLPEKNDYKNHSTEIKIEALPIGLYALITSESSNFEKDNYTCLSYINVSNLAYITEDPNNGKGPGIYVMHRETGQPLENVTIKTWSSVYDYKKQKHVYKEGKTFTSDKNGYAKLSNDGNNTSFSIELVKGDDDLYLSDHVGIYEYPQPPVHEQIRTFVFTDRSIYRPGQTIYFKGIMVNSKGKDNKQHEVMKNRKTTITLKDANYEEVKTLEVTTNEFGSFAGEFKAPEGLLTGTFQLISEYGAASVQIEEYKRPKFEVSYDTLKSTYRVNDIINVKGLAKAYAGNNIDGAQVKYRVYRNARFPYYWSYYRWGAQASSQQEITHGTAVTKADGSFDISFKAIPDESVAKESMPIFDYRIDADVTDLNGETRSGSTNVSVSYQSLLIKIDAPEQIDFNNFNALHVYSTNLAGTHIPAEVTLTFKKLVAPSKTYRSRLWEKPEIHSIPENEFRKDFPLDEYNNENDYQQWKEEKVIWTKKITTTENGLEYLQKIANNDGWYVIEAKATDKNGEEVIDKKYIRLSTYSNPEVLPNEHLLVTKVKIKAEPGEVAKIGIGVPYDNVHLMYVDFRGEGKKEWITLSGNKFFEYQIKEEDRGGFNVEAWYIKNNRFYQTTQFIDVPWTNKQLNISLETFRDKMLPGSEQEWKLKITGSKKEKVSAELLATMYDASLDAFTAHNWSGMHLFQINNKSFTWNSYYNFAVENALQIYYRPAKPIFSYEKSYNELLWWGLKGDGGYTYGWSGGGDRNEWRPPKRSSGAVDNTEVASEDAPPPPMAMKAVAVNGKDNPVGRAYNKNKTVQFTPPVVTDSVSFDQSMNTENIQLRSNFAETAFFFPQLQTDNEGNIILKFKAPDALTKWKLMAFGHTQDLQSGELSSTVTTQKELMIVPNTPRFFREGDKMVYSAKVTNLSEKDVEGNALLQLFDALDEKNVDVEFKNIKATIPFSIKKGESASLTWSIEIPLGFTNPVMVKTFAKANDISDGEQNVVPVLLNSMLVTETLPLPVKANSTRNFKFEKLINAASSNTLRHYNFTLEYTANPTWYAIQSLPYLTEYPYECAEQTFNRYYANVLATHIANSNPKIKEIFSSWQEKDTAALLSNLSKNQELKSALLQETPWVLEAKNEEEQKRNIAALFNLNRMGKELERCVRELEMMQTPNGGFTWFKGMPEDRFITQYILTGIGRLMHIEVSEAGSERRIQKIITSAIPYLDAEIKKDYDNLIKYKVDLKKQQISYFQIQYLYMRSFFKNIPVSANAKKAFDYYKGQAGKYWLNQGKYMQGMSALALQRWDDNANAQAIIKSLRENAIHNKELGMYWKDLTSSYWWYEAPIEAQSIMIEAFKEVAMSEEEVDELKIWLLKNKQTTNWKTTKATADACYALLLNGSYWLAAEPEVTINLGDRKIVSSQIENREAGTGYFKTSYNAEEIRPEMGNITVQVKSDKAIGTTWGAVYWQYFETLDKITAAETPLKLKKQLYKITVGDKGEQLTPITENSPLQVGDKVKVRIELRVDRAMEYVHMKDMRGACFEPVNVLSNYKYQGGLGYYEATKDASTNFFFSYLQKGTYVFEYPMFVTNKGDYSNGIASIQCMYAPEFSSHSEGIRVKVK